MGISRYLSVATLLPIIIRYVEILRPIILVVEAALGPGEGAEKKARVKAAAAAALKQIHDKDLPLDDKMEKLVDALIDFVVATLNESGEMDEATSEWSLTRVEER